MIGDKKRCIGLIFGGYSNEHEVSISSAKTVYQAFNSKINKQRFMVKAFYITNNGEWLDSDHSKRILSGEIKNNPKKKQEIFNQKKINFLDGIEFQNVDVWFPLLHGFNGEDGSIHGLLKFTKKPFVGCGILGSALGMDKIIMKTIFSELKIPQVNYLVFQALEKAWKIDQRILVEEGLQVREIECGIIGNSKLLTSEIGEVKYSSDWYDYDSKYNSNNKITIPAEIDSTITKQIKDIAIQSCKALNIFGFARVDFFLEKSSNKILLNEINTIPGFTKNSMFPMLWEASGLNIEQLVAKLVDISLNF